MRRQNLIACLMLLLLLSACQKDFTPQVPGGNGMVINSMFNSNGRMTVYLTTSYPATNQNNNVTAITDATIALYENNIFKEDLHYVPSDTANTFGYYASNLTPKNGSVYTVVATEKNYPNAASATDVIPPAVQVTACNLLQFPDTLNGNVVVNLQFQDNPDTENYYRLDMYLVYTELSILSNHDTVLQHLSNNIEPFVTNAIQDTVRDPGNFLLFTNRGFSGQLKQLQIQGLVNALAPNVTSADIKVELHAVSKAHYEYYRTLQVYNNTNENTGIQAYVFSNVINGYGIFCGENWKENILVVR